MKKRSFISRLSLILVLAMSVSVLFAACAKDEAPADDAADAPADAPADDAADRETVVIGASYNSLMNDVFTVSKTLMETWAKEPLEPWL